MINRRLFLQFCLIVPFLSKFGYKRQDIYDIICDKTNLFLTESNIWKMDREKYRFVCPTTGIKFRLHPCTAALSYRDNNIDIGNIGFCSENNEIEYKVTIQDRKISHIEKFTLQDKYINNSFIRLPSEIVWR